MLFFYSSWNSYLWTPMLLIHMQATNIRYDDIIYCAIMHSNNNNDCIVLVGNSTLSFLPLATWLL